MNHRDFVEAYRNDLGVNDGCLSIDQSDGPVKGARYAAASKRYKQSVCAAIINNIVENEEADITPTLAGHMIKSWLGRGVSNRFLLSYFGTAGRTASTKSKDVENVHHYIEKYRSTVMAELETAEKNMSTVRSMII
jgi:hypothetical protein